MLLVLIAISAGGWLAAAGFVFLVRQPAEPPVGPKTLDLGPEPPAVASFLVHDFRVTADAVPATLLDLAARNQIEIEQRGPGVYYVRLRTPTQASLKPYEQRILELLQRRAADGVIPAGALTTGVAEESKRWRRTFGAEVVADAKELGLSRDAVDGRAFTVLGALAFVPGLLVWMRSEWELAALVVVGAFALLGWIRARHPQWETPAGLEAASRWLGVRAALLEDEEFRSQTPITVAFWDRHLAYGAALGAAPGAIGPLPMGTESDTEAWSSYSGRWRPVRIAYPRLWPPAWGADPVVAMLGGGAVVVGSAAFLYFLGPLFLDGGAIGLAIFVAPCIAVVVGAAVVVMAWSDWLSSVEVTGPILRLRDFGDENDRRYYVAVDDGSSRTIRAWRVSLLRYQGLAQGDVVTARLTRNLRCVRWIIPAGEHSG